MEWGPFVIAGGALFAALMGIAAQVRFQARAARLALYEKRIEVLNEVEGLLHDAITISRAPLNALSRRHEPLSNWPNPNNAMVALAESRDRVNGLRNTAAHLFGTDIERLTVEALWLASMAQTIGRRMRDVVRIEGADRQEGLDEVFRASRILTPVISRTISELRASAAHYVSADRTAGLSWWHRRRVGGKFDNRNQSPDLLAASKEIDRLFEVVDTSVGTVVAADSKKAPPGL